MTKTNIFLAVKCPKSNNATIPLSRCTSGCPYFGIVIRDKGLSHEVQEVTCTFDERERKK